MTYPNLQALSQNYQLVLGSGSPRRVELLTEIGLPFTQSIPHIAEEASAAEEPYDYALRLAEEKGMAVSARFSSREIIIGCDTIVVLEHHLLEKPESEEDAFRILSLLSGNGHVVCTAVSFVHNSRVIRSGFELTKVFFNPLSPDRIREYIRSGEPMDKAGAYGIQGMGGFLVDRIDGNLDTVVGLPRTLLERLAGEVLYCLQTS
jgi:septum formation protein